MRANLVGKDDQTLYHGCKKPWTSMLKAQERLLAFDQAVRGLESIAAKDREFLVRSGGAAWFTDCESVAEGYADQYEKASERSILKVAFNYRRPLDLRIDENVSKFTEMERIESTLSDAYKKQVEISTQYGFDKGLAHFIVRDSSILIEYARQMGFDALIYPDTDIYGRSGHTSFVAWSPESIAVISMRSYDGPKL